MDQTAHLCRHRATLRLPGEGGVPERPEEHWLSLHDLEAWEEMTEKAARVWEMVLWHRNELGQGSLWDRPETNDSEKGSGAEASRVARTWADWEEAATKELRGSLKARERKLDLMTEETGSDLAFRMGREPG